MLTPRQPFIRWAVGPLLTLAVALASAASAAAPDGRWLRIGVERIAAGALEAEAVRVHAVARGEGADPLSLRIEADRVALPAAGLALARVSWACERLVARQPLACAGPLRVEGRPAGTLDVELSESRTGIRWSQGRRRLDIDQSPTSDWRIAAARLPVAWLGGLAASIWPDGRLSEGTLSGRLAIPMDAPGTRVDGDLRLDALAFDTPDGSLAGAGLSVPLRLRYVSSPAVAGQPARTQVSVDARLVAGELLVSPIYLAVPAAGIAVAVSAESRPTGGWRVSRWAWRDADAVRAEGDATLDADGALLALRAEAESPDLSALRGRYLDGVLAPAGFADLQLAGRGRGGIALDAEGLAALTVDLRETVAVDPKGRFSMAGLGGDLRWSRDGPAVDSRLRWQAAALYGIGLGDGAFAFRSADGQLALREPLRAATLGGHLRVDRLEWRPARGGRPARMAMGLALEALDLGSLSQRLGWPDFEGTLGGSLPNALYEGNRITFEGGLAMQLFGGQVRIDDLALERPFGVAPSLAASLRFQDIDLAPLTRAFGFGEITGRLDGRIRDLRLVDWTPVAFDARLLTDRNFAGARRISQRAVQDISDLGGSGLVAGLQARLLRTFDDFGYDRIGIGCVLRDNVCAMTGLKRRGAGFVIVEGRGLPRIEVVGFRREVDWPTLVSRLRDATEGDTLRIE